MDEDVPLYSRFKKYFGYLNTGHKGKKHDIFAYNGGLFAPDEVLDSLEVDDQLLFEQTAKLTRYDFETDVDVNILGHIFEHSLNEIEEITAGSEGRTIAYKDTKRKRDGVFYTPKYITQYIVRHTLGTLCNAKKQAFRIAPDDFTPDQRKAKKRELLARLDEYRAWLLTVTVLDPACGSGAFLNEALDYLITEHRQLDEMNANLLGIPLVLSDVENSILENNIYGVDLNDESIEIAKLSLWLRTARRGRKLSSLNRNIKVGNSLIHDVSIDNEKAFNWMVEFADVINKGGFDIIIGNPPYVPSRSLSNSYKEYFYRSYSTTEYQINLYSLFIEKGYKLLINEGYIGFIVPNYFLSTQYDKSLRHLIFKDNYAKIILNTGSVFDSANVETLILIGQKSQPNGRDTIIFNVADKSRTLKDRLLAISNELWTSKNAWMDSEEEINITLSGNLVIDPSEKLVKYVTFSKGMQPYEEGKGNPPQTRAMMDQEVYHSSQKVDDSYLPLLTASSVKRYQIKWENKWIKYGSNLAAPRKKSIFEGPRILLNRIMVRGLLNAVYVEKTFINNSDIFNIIPKDSTDETMMKVITAILCSKFCGYYLRQGNINLQRAAFPKINVNTLETFPIPELATEHKELINEHVDKLLKLYVDLNFLTGSFIQLLNNSLSTDVKSKKIQGWPSLSFKDFIAELTKQKVKLSLSQQAEWMAFLAEQQAKARTTQTLLDQTEREINQLVYQLYGLTDEEIAVVEGR